MKQTKKRIHINQYSLLLILALTLVLAGGNCKGKKKVNLTPAQKQGSPKEIYQNAKKKIKKHPEKARLMFKEIMHLYPDSPYAGRSKLGIADTYFKQKDSGSLLTAAAEYQEFVNMYPNSPDAVYAKYQVGMCYYKQVKKPGRDQTNTHEAIKALENMVKTYPDTEEAQDAKKKIQKARKILATHYFNIGVANFRLKAYKGAVNRFKQVLDDYPDFEKKDKLLYYAGRSYYKMRNFDSAISFFQRIIGDFPKSKYFKKSQGLIKKVNEMKAQHEALKKKYLERKKTREEEQKKEEDKQQEGAEK